MACVTTSHKGRSKGERSEATNAVRSRGGGARRRAEGKRGRKGKISHACSPQLSTERQERTGEGNVTDVQSTALAGSRTGIGSKRHWRVACVDRTERAVFESKGKTSALEQKVHLRPA